MKTVVLIGGGLQCPAFLTYKGLSANRNYMSIAVSVLTTSQVASNSSGVARQENRPQSATAYSSLRYQQGEEGLNLQEYYNFKSFSYFARRNELFRL